MAQNEAMAAFVTGIIQAALDNASARGYPPKVRMLPPDFSNGSWTIEAESSEGSACTVIVWPGPATGPGSERSGSR